MAAAEGSSQLMDELRESYLAGGGTDEDWRDLVSRPNLPDWTLQWPGTHMSDFPDRLTEMARYYMRKSRSRMPKSSRFEERSSSS